MQYQSSTGQQAPIGGLFPPISGAGPPIPSAGSPVYGAGFIQETAPKQASMMSGGMNTMYQQPMMGVVGHQLIPQNQQPMMMAAPGQMGGTPGGYVMG